MGCITTLGKGNEVTPHHRNGGQTESRLTLTDRHKVIFKTSNDLLNLNSILATEVPTPSTNATDLRHTDATIVLLQGVHPKVVHERLGHSKMSTAMDIYSHVMPNMQKDAVERFEIALETRV